MSVLRLNESKTAVRSVWNIFYFYLQNIVVILYIGPIPDLEEPVWSIT